MAVHQRTRYLSSHRLITRVAAAFLLYTIDPECTAIATGNSVPVVFSRPLIHCGGVAGGAMASLVYLHSAAAIRRVAGCGRRRLSPYYVAGIRATHAATAPDVALSTS